MSIRPKAFLKQAKSKGKKEQKLDTADDFQAAGVDFEDAAGKWRAGDPAKSMRFFDRAIEVYERGLQQYPHSLDLAYNKARVQLELATHPILIKQLSYPVLDQLKIALQSHRVALTLDQKNADTLFNTSQVLTSIAEEVARSESQPESVALQALEEALELQKQCFAIQEVNYEASNRQRGIVGAATNITQQANISDDEDGGVNVDATAQAEQWFSIIEPVTIDVLIDTVLAQLNTLTSLCGILTNLSDIPPTTLPWIEQYASSIFDVKLPWLLQDHPEKLPEVALAKAVLRSALLEAAYCARQIDTKTYMRERDAAFSDPGLPANWSAEVHIANARSYLSLNYAINTSALSTEEVMIENGSRWNTLSAIVTNLQGAAKQDGISSEVLSTTHLLRGDASLLQYLMSFAPCSYKHAITNANQSLKNAEVFYRNASKLAPEAEDKESAAFKSAVASYLGGSHNVLSTFVGQKNVAWIKQQLEEMELPPDFNSEFFLAQYNNTKA